MASDKKIIEVEEPFTYTEDGKKPIVDRPEKKHGYRPFDKVYIQFVGTQAREGPYFIESAEGGKYSLCDEDGSTVKGGQFYEEKDLVKG